MDKNNKMITVVETTEFEKQAAKFLSPSNKLAFINFIAENPTAGELIVGTGGVRKVRWASDPTKGKSGGARVIYFYHSDEMPLFLFTVFSKSYKENISQSDKNELRKIVRQLVEYYEGYDYD